jgi:ankyrin repeat protein
MGESLLQIACNRGHVEVTRFLIHQAKVSLDVQDMLGRNPLHDACQARKPNVDLLILLIEKRWKHLCLPDFMGKTPLEYLPDACWRELRDRLTMRPDLLPLDTL